MSVSAFSKSSFIFEVELGSYSIYDTQVCNESEDQRITEENKEMNRNNQLAISRKSHICACSDLVEYTAKKGYD